MEKYVTSFYQLSPAHLKPVKKKSSDKNSNKKPQNILIWRELCSCRTASLIRKLIVKIHFQDLEFLSLKLCICFSCSLFFNWFNWFVVKHFSNSWFEKCLMNKVKKTSWGSRVMHLVSVLLYSLFCC